MSKELYSGELNIEYGQFYFDSVGEDFDDEDDEFLLDEAFSGQENGLCGSSVEGKLMFIVGPQTGLIELKVELLDQEPALAEGDEDVVETNFVVTNDDIHLCEWGWEETHSLNLPKNNYIVRYSIKGMDKDYEDDDDWDSPISGQTHLIQLWPGSLAKDRIILETEAAKYWHDSAKKF